MFMIITVILAQVASVQNGNAVSIQPISIKKPLIKPFGANILETYSNEKNWAVVAEGIQTVLRRAGYPSPYEALKALTRTNAHITRESIAEFIESLDVAESVKQELRAITPQSYTGVFE